VAGEPAALGEEDASVSGGQPTAPDASLDAGVRVLRIVESIDGSILDAEELDAGLEDVVEDAAVPLTETDAEMEAAPVAQPPPPPVEIRCGWRICPEGQVCCNWGCSTCALPGETCNYFCGAPGIPISIPCGPNTCNATEICCNPSCGICVPPGGTCSQERCPSLYDPFSAPCGINTCNVGQYCCNPSCGLCKNAGEPCGLECP
jgi:hypothetical protein